MFLGENAYETLSDLTIASFSNFLFPRHSCVSHLSVFPLIHSSALHHSRTERIHSGAPLLAGFQLGLAHQRHWCEIKGGRLFLLSHHLPQMMFQKWLCFLCLLWLWLLPGCSVLCSRMLARQSPPSWCPACWLLPWALVSPVRPAVTDG